jgi:nucleotide-binding universal stress UspA family protein
MNVLIAYDGSAPSDVTLHDLKCAGLPDVVDAELMFVAEVWIPPEDSYTGPSIWEIAIRDVAAQGRNTMANARRSAEQAAGRLRDDHPEWKIVSRVEAGSATLQIVERAERWPADLVIVGAQTHAVVVERLGLGSVALRVLTHLQCPVRVARQPVHSSRSELRIAVGVDGSPDSQAALREITQRNWPAGTEARAISVVDHRVLTVPETLRDVTGNPAASASEAIANGAAALLRRAGLTASAYVLNGDPKRVLVQACREWETDCLFVGARGLTGVERFLLGSVSTSVAMHASCSVEVVHMAARVKHV